KTARSALDAAGRAQAAEQPKQADHELGHLDKVLQDEVKVSGGAAAADVKAIQDLRAKIKAGGKLGPEDVNRIKQVTDRLAERLLKSLPANVAQAIGSGPNADRAAATYLDLKKLQGQDKHDPKRLDDDTIRLLTVAVARPRSADARGQAGV